MFPPIADKPHGRKILKLLGRWTSQRKAYNYERKEE